MVSLAKASRGGSEYKAICGQLVLPEFNGPAMGTSLTIRALPTLSKTWNFFFKSSCRGKEPITNHIWWSGRNWMTFAHLLCLALLCEPEKTTDFLFLYQELIFLATLYNHITRDNTAHSTGALLRIPDCPITVIESRGVGMWPLHVLPCSDHMHWSKCISVYTKLRCFPCTLSRLYLTQCQPDHSGKKQIVNSLECADHIHPILSSFCFEKKVINKVKIPRNLVVTINHIMAGTSWQAIEQSMDNCNWCF